MIARLLYSWHLLCLQWHQGMRGLYEDQQAECERKWHEAVRRQRQEADQIGRYQSKLLAADIKADQTRAIAAEY